MGDGLNGCGGPFNSLRLLRDGPRPELRIVRGRAAGVLAAAQPQRAEVGPQRIPILRLLFLGLYSGNHSLFKGALSISRQKGLKGNQLEAGSVQIAPGKHRTPAEIPSWAISCDPNAARLHLQKAPFFLILQVVCQRKSVSHSLSFSPIELATLLRSTAQAKAGFPEHAAAEAQEQAGGIKGTKWVCLTGRLSLCASPSPVCRCFHVFPLCGGSWQGLHEDQGLTQEFVSRGEIRKQMQQAEPGTEPRHKNCSDRV